MDSVLDNFLFYMLNIISRVCILELNIARIDNVLKGDTAEERFHYFINNLQDKNNILSILVEYPVLARLVVEKVQEWDKNIYLLIQRLCVDWDDLCSTFQLENNDYLVECIFGAGDKHKGGQSVGLLKFSSNKIVVYKPRSLSPDVNFQYILDWLNKNQDIKFKTYQIIEHEDYGWVQYVPHQYCETITDIESYYERFGGLLAITHILKINDLHHENIIASGSHPILIDLETMFGADMILPSEIQTNTLFQRQRFSQQSTVLGTGLIPQKLQIGDGQVDISGFSDVSGQETPYKVPQIRHIGRDDTHLVKEYATLVPSQNIPTSRINTQEVPIADKIIAGFIKIYMTVKNLWTDKILEEMLNRFDASESCTSHIYVC